MTTDPTPQQQAIVDAVDQLRQVLADVVPWTTMHYAVEQLRTPLRVLRREAPGITTHDRIPRPTPAADPTPEGSGSDAPA
ncbi:hypothetical protein ACGFIF_42855 [Kribbella sp. NPDC049174]|uniref:hypothetical protein n=1 Tax=Kribbella sp. NPDC049174 TaxID=3364112 RepID=UPI00370FAFE4